MFRSVVKARSRASLSALLIIAAASVSILPFALCLLFWSTKFTIVVLYLRFLTLYTMKIATSKQTPIVETNIQKPAWYAFDGSFLQTPPIHLVTSLTQSSVNMQDYSCCSLSESAEAELVTPSEGLRDFWGILLLILIYNVLLFYACTVFLSFNEY